MNDKNEILKTIAFYYKLDVDELKSKKRTALIAKARFIFFYLARTETNESYFKISNMLNRNHATAMHGYNSIKNQILLYKDIAKEINEIRCSLNQSIIIKNIDLLSLCL